jgi:beta-1,4-mannosyl-glycoprotein beta-1,4-N-acetylglucosaminyltransferase
MKIVDCFTFYNELTLLEYRLATLIDVVDHFIIVEANQTHMGKPKELYYSNNMERYAKFSHKIIHVVVDLPHTEGLNTVRNDQWRNEEFQRNCIIRGFSRIDIQDEDVIMISDLDEIPDPTTLQNVKNGLVTVTAYSLEQDFYYYNLYSRFLNKWTMAKILSFGIFQDLGVPCNSIRAQKFPHLKKGGWHLSYFGDKYFIQNKLQNFAHAEHNTPTTTNLTNIQWHIDNVACLVGDQYKMKHLPLNKNDYLPPNADIYLKDFV